MKHGGERRGEGTSGMAAWEPSGPVWPTRCPPERPGEEKGKRVSVGGVGGVTRNGGG